MSTHEVLIHIVLPEACVSGWNSSTTPLTVIIWFIFTEVSWNCLNSLNSALFALSRSSQTAWCISWSCKLSGMRIILPWALCAKSNPRSAAWTVLLSSPISLTRCLRSLSLSFAALSAIGSASLGVVGCWLSRRLGGGILSWCWGRSSCISVAFQLAIGATRGVMAVGDSCHALESLGQMSCSTWEEVSCSRCIWAICT